MDHIDKNIEECNPNKKYKLLIVFDNMTAEMFSNNQPNSTVTQLFIRGRKLTCLYHKSYCAKRCYTKFCAPFFYGNSKQEKRQQHLKFYEPLQKMYCKTVFFFIY